jgi:hypothetical protein
LLKLSSWKLKNGGVETMFNYYLLQQYFLQQHYKDLYYKLISRQNEVLDVSGVWNTDYYGRIFLEQDGDNIKGTFRYGKGIITGVITGNILNAQWTEMPTHECPLHAGRLRFVFSSMADSFIGSWGVCQEPLNKTWNGFKLQDKASIDVSGEWFTTNFGKIVFTQDGDAVNATYQFKNGKIEGNMDGYTLKGYWSAEPSYNCYYDKGRIEIDFDFKGEEFTGIWGLCEDEPTTIFSGIRVR